MSSEVDEVLLQRLRVDPPQSTLIVAPQLSQNLLDYSKESDDLNITHVVFDGFEETTKRLGRYDFTAVMNSTFDSLTAETAQQLVARLRDIHTKLLWVAVSDEPGCVFSSKDAAAQGMRMVDPTKFGTMDTKWFEFSLKFYKPVPKWLNARDWANPDRWDKDRW